MRRLPLATLALVPLVTVSLVLMGCSGGGGDKEKAAKSSGETTKETKSEGKSKESSSSSSKGSGLTAIESKGTGTLKGAIKLKGPKPDMEKLTAAIAKLMDQKPDDKEKACTKGSPEEVAQQSWRIGSNNQVGNVVVWLEPPSGSYFKIEKDKLDKHLTENLVIDQPHCAFIPHVSILFPNYRDPANPSKRVPTGQKLVVKNSAVITHNTKWGDESGKQEKGNETLPAKMGDTVHEKVIDNLVPSKEPVQVQCTIHTWMDGYIWVLDTPYATVSKGDDLKVKPDDPTYGTYEIKNVPAGVKVKIKAWHEKAGFLTPPAGADIDLKEGETTHDFDIEAK